MADATIIVAPLEIAQIIGVHAVKISARKFYACDDKLKILFRCARKSEDNVTQDFVPLVRMIAARASIESLPKKKDIQKA